MRLLVSGGGSAGHVLPALAVLDELKSQNVEILYVGSHHGPDARLVTGTYPYRSIFTGKLRRYGAASLAHPLLILRNIGDLALLMLGTLQALWIVGRFRPDVVFCNGGFTSVPVALAAAVWRRPVLIQEADQTFGVANRILRHFAQRIAVAYPSDTKDPREVATGNPIQQAIFSPQSLPKEFGDSELPLILVTGGTKGATKINEAVFASLVQLLEVARVVHITGAIDIAKAEELRARLSLEQQSRYFPRPFLEAYPAVLQSADVVVTRAGAGSLWEAAALAKPMIIVPITRSANNHQLHNAQYFSSRGAAVLLSESEVGEGLLLETVKRILADPKDAERLGAAAKKLIAPDGAKKVAELIVSLANSSSA